MCKGSVGYVVNLQAHAHPNWQGALAVRYTYNLIATL